MESYDNPFVVAETSGAVQASFYRKAYGLAALAFIAWAGVLGALFFTGAYLPICNFALGSGRFGWLIVLGLFWVGTSVAQNLAFSQSSRLAQYAGLALYIFAEAVIFVPLIALVAARTSGDIMQILAPAGAVTGLLAFALTATVFMTRTDFSFLRTAVTIGSFAALGAIILFSVFGINPGSWFSLAMIVLMSAAILWQTWQVKEKYAPDQYVGAAVVIFAGFMTLLWYVIQLFLNRRN
ncbi:MAG: Bax inhibitor-1 family protein [Puniceicoccales bacterium]|jgi:FtsH-binding integral membrane protein|nr:Bax inhibitor-1 family protein [Puniceicoccales bacterium]